MKIGLLNAGAGSWVFDALAKNLSSAIWIELVREPAKYSYVLGWEGAPEALNARSFVPVDAIRVASDKRLIAQAFLNAKVPAPKTVLCETVNEVEAVLKSARHRWALKYPTGSGASGHRILASVKDLPANWPTPYVVQEFIELARPEVYRLYGVAGELFGFNARRFGEGKPSSPWVAHARGARYVYNLEMPAATLEVAKQALRATGLWNSMGCVDLLQRSSGEWLALEVGTDGICNHIDREVENPELIRAWDQKVAEAFWKWVGETPPWGTSWRYRE